MANTKQLTSKQEAFAQAVAGGLNQSDAYRFAYEAGDMSPATIWNNAYVLAKHNEVAARIRQIRDVVTARTAWSKRSLVEELVKNLEMSRQEHRFHAANRAVMQIARLEGLL